MANPKPGFVSRQREPEPTDVFGYRSTKIEAFPRGYPRLAAFVNSDRDFVMFRFFGRLHARILLQKQDELAELEQRLEQIDRDETTMYFLTTRRRDANANRRNILAEIEQKLKDYDKMLALYYQQLQRPEPNDTKAQGVVNWMAGNKPLSAQESNFLDDWDDLRCPESLTDQGGLEAVLEAWASSLRKRGICKLFSLQGENSKSDDPNVLLFTRSAITATSRFLSVAFAVITLIVPVVILYKVQTIPGRLGVIAASTALFSSMLCWLTQSRNYEIFSAAAAYCAVMVVFVGNLP